MVDTPDIQSVPQTGWTPFFLQTNSAPDIIDLTTYTNRTPGPTVSDTGWFLTGIPSIQENEETAPTDVAKEVEQNSNPGIQSSHPFINTSELDKDNGISDSYYNAIAQHESGNSNTASNPSSSALGKYQFLKGTWEGLMKQFPDLGLTSNGRTDEAQQELAIRAFTGENAKILKTASVPVNNGSLYAAHFLGAGEASKVWNTDPSTSMTDLVTSKVVAANPFLRHMDVGQFKLWASKAGGG